MRSDIEMMSSFTTAAIPSTERGGGGATRAGSAGRACGAGAGAAGRGAACGAGRGAVCCGAGRGCCCCWPPWGTVCGVANWAAAGKAPMMPPEAIKAAVRTAALQLCRMLRLIG
ncbi:hypothetical protein [Skermanella pratensis]|uniref:hypothetical protein n=1 Tax=Skermanella pratensis TaxID=2233999 RepID=UPI00178795CA|nr:hypothetical protein [Skermanella pratensis]